MLGTRQPKHRPDCLGVPEAGGHVDCGPIGQRHHGANARDRHQTPTHLIIPDDGQQAPVQDPELFAKYPSDNE